MKYEWKSFSNVKIKAEVVGEELERIRIKNSGRLRTEDIVKESKPKKAPLHNYFEWDDKKAAHKHRLEQARYIIRHIVVIPDSDEDIITNPIRTYVRSEDDNEGFMHTIEAMSEKETRQKILERAWRELKEWKARYENFKELALVFEAIEKVGKRKKRKAA